MSQPTSELDRYLSHWVVEAYEEEHRPVAGVKYLYKVLNGNLLFVLKCQYQRVERRIIWKLINNLHRLFDLKLNLCIPDPYRCGISETTGATYSVMSMMTGIDPNYSISPWHIFGKPYTIRSRYGNCFEGGTPHLDKLAAHGYSYVDDRQDWNKFLHAFKEAYGKTPLEMHMDVLQAKEVKT